MLKIVPSPFAELKLLDKETETFRWDQLPCVNLIVEGSHNSMSNASSKTEQANRLGNDSHNLPWRCSYCFTFRTNSGSVNKTCCLVLDRFHFYCRVARNERNTETLACLVYFARGIAPDAVCCQLSYKLVKYWSNFSRSSRLLKATLFSFRYKLSDPSCFEYRLNRFFLLARTK